MASATVPPAQSKQHNASSSDLLAKFDLTDDEPTTSNNRQMRISKEVEKYSPFRSERGLVINDGPSIPRNYLTDRELSAGGSLRIKEGVDANHLIQALLPDLPTTSQKRGLVIPEIELARLVRELTSRRRREGIPPELRQGNALARRLTEVFTFSHPSPVWLWRPLFHGLLLGGDELDKTVCPPSGAQPMSVLTWLVQWKSLQKVFSWKGSDELVELALAAGASPNVPVRNGSTAIFFAVKYGSHRTVDLLIKHGADLRVRDRKGRSCIWNALERPQPKIISSLLEKLPANELFPFFPSGKREESFQTAVDYLFAAQLSLAFDANSNPEYPWSWEILGIPSTEDVALSMMHFAREGVTFTPDDVTLSLVGFVMRGENPNKRKNQYPNYADARQRLEILAKMVVGLWLPKSAHERLTNPEYFSSDEEMEAELSQSSEEINTDGEEETGSEQSQSKDTTKESASIEETCCQTEVIQTCELCNNDLSVLQSEKSIRLYCGHEFCLNCIFAFARGTRAEVTCPTCHQALCLELTSSKIRRQQILTNAYGRWEGPHGPKHLSSEQLREECALRNYSTRFRKDERLRVMLDEHLWKSGTGKDQIAQVEMNSNVPITNGVDINLVAPKGGPAVIPISLKGVSVLAFMSTSSAFTTLSPEFVNQFGLRRSHLSSKKFKNILGVPLDVEVHLIEEFTFQVGDIEITLRNALELTSRASESWIGMQLGQDFFRSGVWCVADTRLDGQIGLVRMGSFVSTDGFGHTMLNQSKNKVEQLRYYNHDGKTFRTPLLHVQPFKYGGLSNWVNVAKQSNFQECHWCCVTFPEGMLCCEECGRFGKTVHYCSEACRDAASPIHDALHEMKRKISRQRIDAQ